MAKFMVKCFVCEEEIPGKSLFSHLLERHKSKRIIWKKNPCPLCIVEGKPEVEQGSTDYGIMTHLFNEHLTKHERMEQGLTQLHYTFALVVCMHPDGRLLVVEESDNQGWWLPGGHVDPGETFQDAGIRETVEEAGVDVELTGVYRFEHSAWFEGGGRVRVIFAAKPKDPDAAPKYIPDKESESARYVTWEELNKLHLRGGEPLQWFKYIRDGGAVYPMSVLVKESDPVVAHQ